MEERGGWWRELEECEDALEGEVREVVEVVDDDERSAERVDEVG